MYGNKSLSYQDNQIIANEVAITNLIAIANNQVLFAALDDVTKNNIIKIISGYAYACVSSIMNSRDTDAIEIQQNMYR